LALAWLGLALFLVAAAEAPAYSAGRQPYPVHQAYAQARVSERLGVDFAAIAQFYAALAAAAPAAGDQPPQSLAPAVAALAHTPAARSALLRQLARQGRHGLNADLFRALFELRIALNRQVPIAPEAHRTLALLALLEDLVRQQRAASGLPAAWYDRAAGFLPGGSHRAFAYQDGDILLVVGGSSISALITQSTYPQRKFSHAIILRIRANRLVTAETLIETGAISRDDATFSGLELHAVQVLRWKDAGERAAVAARAADRAWTFAQQRLPYDSAIDLGNPDKLFCSELVARAYADVTGTPLTGLIPEFARVRSAPVLAYLGNLGVSNPVMVSPGDLTASPFLEVVAEFRPAGQLAHLWEMMIMADVFIERLDMGFRFRPDPWRNVLAHTAAAGDFFLGVPRTLLGVDLALIPQSLDRRALACMLTQENVLFRQAGAHARRQLGAAYTADLLALPPWEWRTALSWAVQEDRTLRRVLAPPR
jgi:hypothetical protein